MPSCLIRRFGHVDAIGPASRRRKRGQPVRGPFEESLRPDLVPPSSMGESNADLRKSLPQIRLLGRSSFPTRFEDLMGCERAASVDELSSRPERLLRRQGFLRHRLDAPGAIGQWPAQRVSRPCLTSTTLGVPITLSSSHTTSVPEKRSPDRLLSASLRRKAGTTPAERRHPAFWRHCLVGSGKAVGVRQDHEVETIARSELGQGARDVCLDGVR